tara:strand:+ start:78 stop:341 length:264 start_codon:yes stop_codon:yes gene_type:complete
MKSAQLILATMLIDQVASRGGGISGIGSSSNSDGLTEENSARISNYYQSNPDYASYGISRWYNEKKLTSAKSNESPYVIIFGGEVTY